MKVKANAIPLHSQLRDELEKDILNGKYKPGDLIPSENELALSHNISRPTVRQAFSELVSLGLLNKIKGKGTFVSDFDKKMIFDHTKGFLHSLLDCNDNTNREIISVYMVDGNEKIGTSKLSDIFGADFKQGFSSKFIKTEYKFPKDNVYCESYLPLAFFPEAPGHLEKNAQSYDLLTGKIPLEPRNARCTISIANALRKHAEVLGLSQGSPVIKVDGSLFNGRGMIVEYCISYYKTMNTEIVFNKNRRI
ncbi:MAG: GntR family transcriptional regulator [Clostridia bacterium]